MARARRARAGRWGTSPKSRRQTKIGDFDSPRDRALSAACHGAGRFFAEPAMDYPAQNAADQRRHPEHPELTEGPSTDEQRRTPAARRLHPCVLDVTAD